MPSYKQTIGHLIHIFGKREESRRLNHNAGLIGSKQARGDRTWIFKMRLGCKYGERDKRNALHSDRIR